MGKKTKGLVASLVVVGFLAMTPATAASAATHVENVGGGVWQWGDEHDRAYSNYYHESKTHSATVCDGTIANDCYQDVQIRGIWARASTSDSLLNVEKAYWNTY
ncbi:lactococcin 972 family bacteriocin [Rathayibacter tritici]|uniref:Lactococcin 972 family bacteriocin n=1 Tax=Rathayibacter tritici TaxID=33888 RepID=A0A160KVC1_9MICO|nr:lactococcin 972 family bacteriocin [Rathayibacter tritici]AND17298.1 hypothetical protein A6122_2175 [Rathayibacter tritici]PPI41615.1 lactococcin 972 family bacteriocin [Rathayibacter tritici]